MTDNSDPSIVWITAVIITRQAGCGMELSQTISWSNNCTKNDAIAHAVDYAINNANGGSVSKVTTVMMKIPKIEATRKIDTPPV